jgi:hypothetical protein
VTAYLPLLLALQTALASPFSVGERFEYSAKLGLLKLGSATIQVEGVDTVRGEPAWHFKYTLDGGNAFFKISSALESWTSVREFHTLRFRRDSKENNRRYLRDYAVFGDSGYYRQSQATATTPTPRDPLDDASILYFVRTTPLEVGRTYAFERHFMPELNPITIRVVKRETMELPDGTRTECLILNPVVGEDGLFGKRAEAQLWITADARRIPVQIKTRQRFGPVTLRLERITRGVPRE